ncbi:F-box/kelch-repeat protein At3g23880-like [Solanum dulcamara]|uniref:F-box/kelch-repeat protein At3g23880-like n=1 Tax=Solanum dulcamara TaxID=45834 RepID=UPI002486027D|nr:F-box/kelch-repeat protein At3g23880-like [Solanum dulcamara]
MGSVNGLICLAIKDDGLFIWNPSIRKFKNLPDSRLKLKLTDGYDCPAGAKYGFGYDESNDDYKVVGVLCRERRYTFHHLEVKIYSLKSDSWRSMKYIPDGVQLMRQCMFLNGKLHCAVELNGGFSENRNIMSMDLADEKCGTLEQPLYTGGNVFVKLDVVGSDLSIFCNYMKSHVDV